MRNYFKILFVVVLSLVCFAAEAKSYRVKDIPNVQRQDRTRFVSNPDGILKRSTVAKLDSICYALKQQGVAEVAIVVVDDIKPRDMVAFSQDLFEGWGVGDDELDNGLGILLVRDMHEIRFHTGYGIEGVLPDALCTKIQREYMLPSFRKDNYDEGMLLGVDAVNAVLTGGDLPKAKYGDEEDVEAMIVAFLVVFLLIIVPVLVLIIVERKRIKCPTCGKHKLRVVERVVAEQTNTHVTIIETLVCDNCHTKHTRTTRQNRSNRGGGGGIIFFPMGGFGGGGFGGGGFGGGGFGGGGFGGGGGGSRW